MSQARFQSFEAFFPYYLGEHRNPTCRALHFVGTAGFFGTFAYFLARDPLGFGPPFAAMVILGAIGNVIERKRNAAPVFLVIVAVGVWSQPWLLLGVVWAYFFAWLGHFKVEHNKPATFTYPLWSLLGDFRMWGLMAMGKLWTGDPLEELGLSVPEPEA
ncbi:hypothetical protein PPSIR1_17525 [Plesiocystis pacifica SIR-1]|uniref:DUF962 domain-containing protein n=1 Tax=Plesiocystis pacifica SIR-1 TaxID=391625 RepID=A6GA70_9BACT|nr:DUF962 domain-containing protein [Plesiocystis pacifica]EDM77283.1 hypothetical protein PPSIR1_17525 [Plesiocystis pacifica SIR-1]